MTARQIGSARFEIIADGRSVAVIDHKLDTQDEYFIAQTPLKFLLADHIDIRACARILSVSMFLVPYDNPGSTPGQGYIRQDVCLTTAFSGE